MTTEGPHYSVVIPVYQRHDCLVELVDRLSAVFTQKLESSFEILLIDDGSAGSRTWQVCSSLADSRAEVGAIRLARNYGKPSAVLCGLGHARGNWIVTIDDDLQQRPEDIPALAEYREHDVVVGRFSKREHGWLVVLTSRIKRSFDRKILRLPCEMSPLKLFKSEVAARLLSIRTPRPFIPALLAQVTSDFVSVDVKHEKSRYGRSRYSLRGRFRQFSNLLISNSNLLLRCAGWLGVAVAASGFAFAGRILWRRISGDVVSAGWPSLVVINLVFGGLVLLSLSLIGEYLIRILEASSQTPAYHSREVLEASSSAVQCDQPVSTEARRGG